MRSFRFTISGLMVTVVAVSVALAALRASSATWASVTFLMACGVLSLGVVGAACGRASDRAWWLGFSLFGWGFMALVFWNENPLKFPAPPTTSLMWALRFRIVGYSNPRRGFVGFGYANDYLIQIGHCFWSLAAGALGGVLARVFFGAPAVPTVPPADRPEAARSPGRRWRHPALLIPAVGLLLTLAALVGASRAPGLLAGTTLLLTWGVLGLSVLAAVLGRGRRRAAFLGAALFGVGYMLLICNRTPDYESWALTATNRLLNALRPWLPPVVKELPGRTDGIAYANARAFVALDRPIPMHFPQETPLEDVVKYVSAAAGEPDGRDLPIYVDPVGLQEAEKTMQSPATMALEGVPLRTTLRLLLEQLGMTYGVKDGVVIITAMSTGEEEDTSAYEDPFLLIGQCFLTLLAATLGGTLAPLVSDRSGDPAREATGA